METTLTAEKTFNEIHEAAEQIKKTETQHFPEAASFGEKFRQGDIYIALLETVPPQFDATDVITQLAPGTTKGSRHILSHDEIEMFVNKQADVLTGPVFKCDKPVTVTHLEHADVVLPPGTYGITYQRMFATELRRALD